MNAQIQPVYSPADPDLQNGRTIIKSWILHHLHPQVIGFISVLISFAYSALWESPEDIADRSPVRGSEWCCFFYSIIKSYINACCLFSTTTKRCHDAKWTDSLFPCSCSSSRLREGVMKSNEGKETLKRGGCVIQRPMVYWSLRRLSLFLSSQQGGVNCTVFFCNDWRLPSASSVFKLALIFSADRNDFFALAFSPKWHNSLSARRIWADRWRVLS